MRAPRMRGIGPGSPTRQPLLRRHAGVGRNGAAQPPLGERPSGAQVDEFVIFGPTFTEDLAADVHFAGSGVEQGRVDVGGRLPEELAPARDEGVRLMEVGRRAVPTAVPNQDLITFTSDGTAIVARADRARGASPRDRPERARAPRFARSPWWPPFGGRRGWVAYIGAKFDPARSPRTPGARGTEPPTRSP